jgi:hypothetical protein
MILVTATWMIYQSKKMSKEFIVGDSPETLEFCRWLGVNPDGVRRIVLDISAGRIAVAHIELYVSRQAIDFLVSSDITPEVKVLE